MTPPEWEIVERAESDLKRADPSLRIFWNNRLVRYVVAQDLRISSQVTAQGRPTKTWRTRLLEPWLVGVREVDDQGGYTCFKALALLDDGSVVIPCSAEWVLWLLDHIGPRGDQVDQRIEASEEAVKVARAREDQHLDEEHATDQEAVFSGRQYSIGGMDARPLN